MMFQLVELSNIVREIERGLNSLCLLLIEEKSYLLKYELTESKGKEAFNVFSFQSAESFVLDYLLVEQQNISESCASFFWQSFTFSMQVWEWMLLGKFNSFHATLSKPLWNIRKKPSVFLMFLGSMERDQWHEIATSSGQMRLHKQDYHSSVTPSSPCWSQFKGVSKASFICYCNHFYWLLIFDWKKQWFDIIPCTLEVCNL